MKNTVELHGIMTIWNATKIAWKDERSHSSIGSAHAMSDRILFSYKLKSIGRGWVIPKIVGDNLGKNNGDEIVLTLDTHKGEVRYLCNVITDDGVCFKVMWSGKGISIHNDDLELIAEDTRWGADEAFVNDPVGFCLLHTAAVPNAA